MRQTRDNVKSKLEYTSCAQCSLPFCVVVANIKSSDFLLRCPKAGPGFSRCAYHRATCIYLNVAHIKNVEIKPKTVQLVLRNVQNTDKSCFRLLIMHACTLLKSNKQITKILIKWNGKVYFKLRLPHAKEFLSISDWSIQKQKLKYKKKTLLGM